MSGYYPFHIVCFIISRTDDLCSRLFFFFCLRKCASPHENQKNKTTPLGYVLLISCSPFAGRVAGIERYLFASLSRYPRELGGVLILASNPLQTSDKDKVRETSTLCRGFFVYREVKEIRGSKIKDGHYPPTLSFRRGRPCRYGSYAEHVLRPR